MRLQKQFIARRTAMIRNFSSIFGAAGFVLAVAVCLLATVGDSKAGHATSEQPSARSGDAFRFCSGAMPGIAAITGRIRKNAQI
jgi:hypothetical protein